MPLGNDKAGALWHVVEASVPAMQDLNSADAARVAHLLDINFGLIPKRETFLLTDWAK